MILCSYQERIFISMITIVIHNLFSHKPLQQFLAGWTPLHVAAEGGRDAVVEVLLRHRADPYLVTDTGLDKELTR